MVSSPSPPSKLGRAGFLDRVWSDPSVPKSRPPLGQPGMSLVILLPCLMVLVPSHRPSSEAVASGELACSFPEVSELVPEQPTPRRRTAHPIRKIPTKAISCPWRTTAPSPSLGMCLLLLAPRSMPHQEPWRISTQAYSPKCVEGEFCELCVDGVL